MEGKKRLTATERETLMRLNLALTFLIQDVKSIEARAGMVNRGKWYLGVARSSITRFMEQVYDTVPEDQLQALRRSIMDTSFTIGVKCTATMNNDRQRMRDYGVVVPIEAMNEILNGCHDHCALCGLDTEGQRKCPLRKAFDAIPNDAQVEQDEGCPYYASI